MLLLEDRKKIHKMIFKYVETVNKKQLDRVYHILAHHSLKAELWFKAMDYSELAGLQALRGNANDESVKFFTKALEMHVKLFEARDSIRMETLNVHLGEALYSLGIYSQAIQHFLTALDLNGNPLPKKGLQTAIIKMTMMQYVKGTLSLDSQHKTQEPASTYRASRILEKLCQAAIQNGDVALAAYSAFKMIELCVNLENEGPLLVVGYALCAYTNLITQRTQLAEKFFTRAQVIMKNYPSLPEVDRAIAHMHIGMYHAAHGEWESSLQLFAKSKASFKEYGERKKWRECTLMIGVALHFQSRFEACEKHLVKLLNFAKEDGDQDLQSNALEWKCITKILISGPSQAIEDDFELSRSIYKDLHKDNLSLKISTYYHRLLFGEISFLNEVWNEEEIDEEVEASATPKGSQLAAMDQILLIERFAGKILKHLKESPNLLWWDLYKHTHAIELLLMLYERFVLPQKNKKLFKLIEEGMKIFKSFPFPYATCHRKLLEGKWEYMNGKTSSGHRKCLKAENLASENGIPYVVARAAYEIGKHGKDESASMKLDKAATILMGCGVTLAGNSCFPLLEARTLGL